MALCSRIINKLKIPVRAKAFHIVLLIFLLYEKDYFLRRIQRAVNGRKKKFQLDWIGRPVYLLIFVSASAFRLPTRIAASIYLICDIQISPHVRIDAFKTFHEEKKGLQTPMNRWGKHISVIFFSKMLFSVCSISVALLKRRCFIATRY